ncbi:MAG: hypothetical protein AABM32_05800 [Chloroflexota bacterium]
MLIYAGWLFTFRAADIQARYLRGSGWAKSIPILHRLWYEWPSTPSYRLSLRIGGILCFAVAIIFILGALQTR